MGFAIGVEFESKEAANTFYYSEEYQAAKAVREACSDTDFMIIEGVPE
jgi:uncharacterized protein (DUF1330 family)